MSVHKKLNEARIVFHSMKLKKTGLNKFAGYSYFELADFLIPALQVFDRVGLCAVISFDKDTATMTITDLEDNSSVTITSPMGSAALKGCHEVQNIGAVQTYQRRYLWVAALEIVEHDALDATTGASEVIAKSFRSSPTMGVMDALPPDRQRVIEKAAAYVIERVQADDLYGALEQYDEFVDDEKVALHGKLPAPVRTALRKFKEAMAKEAA